MTARPIPDGLSSAARPPGLPIALNRFVGRDRELEAIRRLLETERLVTLTGSGGTGKTRLASELAARFAAASEAAPAWVDLAALFEPDFVAHQVAGALGIRDAPGRSAADALLEALRSRSLLLVLDNCEHLIDACARLADTLLRSCPGLRLLATSREALGVEGERAFPVAPLSLPDTPLPVARVEEIAGSEAVRLFVERAQAVLPSFALTERTAADVARICHRLDGLPLAIELAAARMRVLTPDQLAARLDDCFRVLAGGARTALPRHRTLRAAIDWSYDLLTDPERMLFERLSVFTGGFTLDAAEEVGAGDDMAAGEVLDLLAALVEKSLVTMREHQGTVRYSLLEVVRQYATERLRERGEETALRERHARWCAALVEAVEPALVRATPSALDAIGAEHDNLRVALDWCESAVAPGAVEIGMRIGARIWFFWLYRAHRGEGRRRLEGLLARPGPHPTAERASVLHGAGTLAWWTGELQAARVRLEESVAAWRTLGNDRQVALALSHLSQPLQDLGESDAALTHAEQAARLARALGDPWLLAFGHVNGLGYVLSRRGDLAAADEVFAEAEALFQPLDYPWGLALARYGRAIGAWQRGELAEAAAHARVALEPLLARGDPVMAARTVLVLAYVAAARGAFERAARLLGAAEHLRESVGAPLFAIDRARIARVMEEILGALGEASATSALAEGHTMGLAQLLEAVEPPLPPNATPPPESSRASPAPSASRPLHPAPEARGPTLQVLALGPLRILHAGDPLSAGGAGSSKPREFLLFLLCHPGGATKEQIGAALWPDASPAQVRSSFHVTLHRLRQMLDKPDRVVFEGERYRVAGPDVEFDAARFETEVVRGLRLLCGGAQDEAVAKLRHALAWYNGDFLEGGSAGPWSAEFRDRWKQLCINAHRALAEWLMERRRDRDADEVYRALLRHDDLSEEAYRGLMRIHARQGRFDEAARLYRQLRTLLREELDDEPDPVTELLARRIEERQPV